MTRESPILRLIQNLTGNTSDMTYLQTKTLTLADTVRADFPILHREVHGKTTAIVGSDLVSLERQARPLLTENLAQNIADLLVDGEW